MLESFIAIIARLGPAPAVLAVLLLALAPAGWRLGWWHFRFAFYRLMMASAICAAAAAVLAVLALALGLSKLSIGEAIAVVLALALGAVLTYVPWHYRRTLARVPRI